MLVGERHFPEYDADGHSPVLAGFAVISHWAPNLLFSVWFGALISLSSTMVILKTLMAQYGRR